MSTARIGFTRELRRLGRKLVLGSGPKRYRLAREIWLDQVMGRAEDELRLLGSLADPSGTALDVGAHRGHYSYVMSKSFGRVVTFEPNAELVRDLAGSALGNVSIHCCALSSRAGRGRLYTPIQSGIDLSGWASLEPDRHPGWVAMDVADVEIHCLDEFALGRVALIKIDVEGHEVEVLEGGHRVIGSSRPVVIVEVTPSNRTAIARYFEAMGYSPSVVARNRLVPLAEGIERYDGPKYNFVFSPDPVRVRARLAV